MARHPAAPCHVQRMRTSVRCVMFQRLFRAKATAFVEATFHVALPFVAILAKFYVLIVITPVALRANELSTTVLT